MLQLIISFVHAHSLPVFMIIGFAGCSFCLTADHIRNRELKKIIESSPKPEEQEPAETKTAQPEAAQSNTDSAGSPGYKAHGRSITNDSVPGTKDPKPPVAALGSAIRRKVLSLNALGYGFMIVAMVGLYHYGYFDRYLGR